MTHVCTSIVLLQTSPIWIGQGGWELSALTRALVRQVHRLKGRFEQRGADRPGRRQDLPRALEVEHRQADLFQVVLAGGAIGGLARHWTAGSSSAIRTAMMAMTTNSSISVKPGGVGLLVSFVEILRRIGIFKQAG